MKLTEWYSGDQKPVRAGPYKRMSFTGFIGYSYFDSCVWSLMFGTPEHAEASRHERSIFQNLPWRGIEK
jgi:hypothetical protein